MTSDPAAGRLSTYAFPDELRVDELLLREPRDADIHILAPAFLDPAIGGEAGLPPVGADELRVMLRDLLPGMRAHGLLAPYVIEDVASSGILGGATVHHFDPCRRRRGRYWLFCRRA